ncbi:uncharacterized protein SCDLUD_002585 [Saccharomycodes ludwigii]|uniref:uncharacterized protein n=1 Tax=Saccharomycodes ludwigii TaxID=36035 RepID=UPI001E83FAE2|nr:hypothetical protein SCDLUD_002585 [Saccharomycodes ludwigii]KAH3901107.1 hypothetical protein SCDLUD_002585 [Saccharomycodes ludwigii]
MPILSLTSHTIYNLDKILQNDVQEFLITNNTDSSTVTVLPETFLNKKRCRHKNDEDSLILINNLFRMRSVNNCQYLDKKKNINNVVDSTTNITKKENGIDWNTDILDAFEYTCKGIGVTNARSVDEVIDTSISDASNESHKIINFNIFQQDKTPLEENKDSIDIKTCESKQHLVMPNFKIIVNDREACEVEQPIKSITRSKRGNGFKRFYERLKTRFEHRRHNKIEASSNIPGTGPLNLYTIKEEQELCSDVEEKEDTEDKISEYGDDSSLCMKDFTLVYFPSYLNIDNSQSSGQLGFKSFSKPVNYFGFQDHLLTTNEFNSRFEMFSQTSFLQKKIRDHHCKNFKREHDALRRAGYFNRINSIFKRNSPEHGGEAYGHDTSVIRIRDTDDSGGLNHFFFSRPSVNSLRRKFSRRFSMSHRNGSLKTIGDGPRNDAIAEEDEEERISGTLRPTAYGSFSSSSPSAVVNLNVKESRRAFETESNVNIKTRYNTANNDFQRFLNKLSVIFIRKSYQVNIIGVKHEYQSLVDEQYTCYLSNCYHFPYFKTSFNESNLNLEDYYNNNSCSNGTYVKFLNYWNLLYFHTLMHMPKCQYIRCKSCNKTIGTTYESLVYRLQFNNYVNQLCGNCKLNKLNKGE